MMRRGQSYFEVERPRIEIIPMIDIMMFLLVFFIMITIQMIAGSGIQLDLPGAATAQKLPPTKITIGVRKDGATFVEGRQLQPADLRALLEKGKSTGQVEVIIAGDKDVSLQSLLHVMDTVRQAGITAVGIAAKADGSS